MSATSTPKHTVFITSVHEHCEPGGYLIGKVARFLGLNGYEVACDHLEGCDTILINSCVVKSYEFSRTETLIQTALNDKTVKNIIVFGCYHAFAPHNGLDPRVTIIGPKDLHKFNDLFPHRIPIEAVPSGTLDNRLFVPDPPDSLTLHDHFVLICQGCLQNCSYCTTKQAKGNVESRPFEAIFADLEEGLKQGKKTISLVADDCGSYGADLKSDLAVLIKKILARYPEVLLKINAIYPAHLLRMYPLLKDSLATGRIVFMTIPVQSGSQRILDRMKRNYDLEQLETLIRTMREIAPALVMHTNIMVNFPTETIADIRDSVRIAGWFDDFVFFDYSEHPNVASSRIFPKISAAACEKRLKIFEKLKEQYSSVTRSKN